MPSVPGFIADLVETRFGVPVQVVETEALAPTLKRVRFRSDELAKRYADGKIGPGVWTVEFRAGRKAMRHYTACAWDFAAGAFDVLFFLRGAGPGRAWAEGLRVGDTVRALGPGSRVVVDDRAARHVVIGDETSLGTARAVIESARNGARVSGVIACSSTGENLLATAGVPLTPIVAATQADLTRRMIEWTEGVGADPASAYYLTGNRDTVTAVGRFLMRSMGVSRRAIHLRVHWAEGKAGL